MVRDRAGPFIKLEPVGESVQVVGLTGLHGKGERFARGGNGIIKSPRLGLRGGEGVKSFPVVGFNQINGALGEANGFGAIAQKRVFMRRQQPG